MARNKLHLFRQVSAETLEQAVKEMNSGVKPDDEIGAGEDDAAMADP